MKGRWKKSGFTVCRFKGKSIDGKRERRTFSPNIIHYYLEMMLDRHRRQ